MSTPSMGKRQAICSLAASAVFFTAACGGSAPEISPAVQTPVWRIGAFATGDPYAASPATFGPSLVVDRWLAIDSATAVVSDLPSADGGSPGNASAHATLVSSWQGRRFHPETIRRLAGSRGALALAAAGIAHRMGERGGDAVIFDFEDGAPSDLQPAIAVMQSVRDSVRAHAKAFTAAIVPAADTTAMPLRPLLGVVDLVVLTFLDERGATSAPGPIVTIDRMRRLLARRVAESGPERIVAAFPTFGYVWRPNQPGEAIDLASARQLAVRAGTDVVRDESTHSLHAIQPGDWELWIGDVDLVRRLIDEARSLGVNRAALWDAPIAQPAATGYTIMRSR